MSIHVTAFTCDHSLRLVCDVCDGMYSERLYWSTGRLHRHEDGRVHRHAPPYEGEVEFLDDGPAEPWVPDTTGREE